ncbi:MAG: hypothetical protein Q7U87_01990, partial [bacterium]|nr:hypothetical protein [bacterium]
MDTIRARGVNFVYSREYIQSRHGMNLWEKLLTRLPPQTAKLWAGPLLSLSNYPFADFKLMLQALSDELGTEKREKTAELYAYIADRSLSTLYKVFFKFSQPAFVLKNYPKLWERFFTSGEVTVISAEKGTAEISFKLPEIFLDWLPSACYGYSKKAVEMAGGTDLVQEETERVKLPDGEWRITYR